MNRKLQLVVGLTALVVMAVSLGLLAWFRVADARQFGLRHQVLSYGGTNYVVQLLETTVGKVDSGYVVIVSARLENPNAFELVLDRNMFILADHDKDYYLPSSSGTQTALIKLPPTGVLEKEAFSFAVADDAFRGTVALQIGNHYFVMIKGEQPFTRQLRSGQFVTFRRRDW